MTNPLHRLLMPALLAIALAGGATAVHADTNRLRLAVVNTPQFSGLIESLLPEFEQQQGIEVEVYSGNDVYAKARAGKADIVISHYGKKDVEPFVLGGYGRWPKMVFANQAVLLGHRSDPASVRGSETIAEALARIAAARAPFIHNDLSGVGYLTEVALETIGQPDRSGWFIDSGHVKEAAILMAEEKKGYVIWGAFPALRFNEARDESSLEILVSEDPALQRVMAAVIVNPDKVPGVNTKAAEALLAYLLSPRTQARIAAFRSPGSDRQLWWPAGRDN